MESTTIREEMNGKVLPHTPLAVDFWQVRKCPHVQLFFLSHMHSDHTVGLTSTWTNRPIYCSPISAKLLKLKLQVKEKWIHPLDLGEEHVLPLDDVGKETLTVTLMDANHCPGSVMFLFQGYFGSILYTGDFRYTPTMLREPCLRAHTTIDVLYLDNTNCDPTRTLPSRQRATQQIKEIIRAHPGHNIVIGLYSLGKETLLVQLAMEFKTWVEVTPERLETLRALELPDVFTTEPGAGRIQAVNQSEIRAANLALWNRQHPTLAILPTGRPMVAFHPNVHMVPYSDHSSFQELEDFVSALRPATLIPIVGAFMPHFSALVSPRKGRRHVLVPESVRHCINRQLELEHAFPNSFLPNRPVRAKPRGVVFESPLKKPSLSDVKDSPTEENGLEDDGHGDALEAAECFPLSLLSQSEWLCSSTVVMSDTAFTLKPKNVRPPKALPHASACPLLNLHSPKKRKRDASPHNERAKHRKDSADSSEKSHVSDDVPGTIAAAPAREEAAPRSPSRTLQEPESRLLTVLLQSLTFPQEEISGGHMLLNRTFLNGLRLSPVNCPRDGRLTFHATVEQFFTASKRDTV